MVQSDKSSAVVLDTYHLEVSSFSRMNGVAASDNHQPLSQSPTALPSRPRTKLLLCIIACFRRPFIDHLSASGAVVKVISKAETRLQILRTGCGVLMGGTGGSIGPRFRVAFGLGDRHSLAFWWLDPTLIRPQGRVLKIW
jgi:hypothetical protein